MDVRREMLGLRHRLRHDRIAQTARDQRHRGIHRLHLDIRFQRHTELLRLLGELQSCRILLAMAGIV